MAEQSKRKGRKTVSKRLFVEDGGKTSKSGKTLVKLFERLCGQKRWKL
jgi:hypothetical protein